MTELPIGTVLIVSGNCTGDPCRQTGELAQGLRLRLGHEMALCVSEGVGEPVVAGIRSLVALGVRRLVILPLQCPGQDAQEISTAVKWASRRWPFLTFHSAAPLTWQEWVGLLKKTALDALAELTSQAKETAVLIVGAGSSVPSTNGDLAKLAHLIDETGEFARVGYAFLDTARPCVPDGLALLARLNCRDIVVVPWLFAPADALRRLSDQVEQTARACNLRATVAVAPHEHPAFLDLLISHQKAALQDDSFLAPSWDKVLTEIARNAGAYGHAPGRTLDAEEAQLRELDRKINELLPPQYQGRYEDVGVVSMGTAPLKFGPDGQVAWGEMWTSYCDLALAGGPAHRGTLLEAVSAAEALAEPDKYQAVVAEIKRGIKLVTGLPVVPSKSPGWVGVRCDSEAMAVWLLRAIIVENVMVRREGEVLYLPAGPRFTLKREIKNVVTVVAKTCHYWSAHLAGRGRPGEPLTPDPSPQRVERR